MTSCSFCQMLAINGLTCHETGCEASWKHEMRDCTDCGFAFWRQHRLQRVCSECSAAPMQYGPEEEE